MNDTVTSRDAIGNALACPPGGEKAWGSWLSRKTRYAVASAFAESSQYDKGHRWSGLLKDRLDLPSSVRAVYGLAPRIADFWGEHIYAGSLDPFAGDGSTVVSSVPIVADNPDVPRALSVLWRDSRLPTVLDVLARQGAVCGDCFLAVNDDPVRQLVTVAAIHPGDVKSFTADRAGNCKGYVIQRDLPDPRHLVVGDDPTASAATVIYREVCSRDGDDVVYKTFLDDEPYDWRIYEPGEEQVGAVWSEHYGFVPLVRVAHKDTGAGWGTGEISQDIALLAELDALAGIVCDHVYKSVKAPFFFEGGSVKNIGLAETPGPDKARFPLLAGEGTPHPLVVPMSIADATNLMRELLASLERRHPELAADGVGLSASGEARRESRRRVEALVSKRRGAYDDALARAFMMALSIGGQRRYPGYRDFTWRSYFDGDLGLRIGPRPVFALDEESRLVVEGERGRTLKALTDAGVGLAVAMRRAGFAETDIRETIRERRGDEVRGLARIKALSFSEDHDHDHDQDDEAASA